MNRKIIAIFLMGCLLSLAGCSKQPSAKVSEGVASHEMEAEKQTFLEKGFSFDYPLGWQILARANTDKNESARWAAEKHFKARVSEVRLVDINLHGGHYIDPEEIRDSTAGIEIKDLILDGAPESPKEYLKTINPLDGQATIKTYPSPLGVEFAVWNGEGIYGPFVIYVTTYEDLDGQKHFVEISYGTYGEEGGYEDIEKTLRPLVDSLRFRPYSPNSL